MKFDPRAIERTLIARCFRIIYHFITAHRASRPRSLQLFESRAMPGSASTRSSHRSTLSVTHEASAIQGAQRQMHLGQKLVLCCIRNRKSYAGCSWRVHMCKSQCSCHQLTCKCIPSPSSTRVWSGKKWGQCKLVPHFAHDRLELLDRPVRPLAPLIDS